jgi:hypothetical protein
MFHAIIKRIVSGNAGWKKYRELFIVPNNNIKVPDIQTGKWSPSPSRGGLGRGHSQTKKKFLILLV